MFNDLCRDWPTSRMAVLAEIAGADFAKVKVVSAFIAY